MSFDLSSGEFLTFTSTEHEYQPVVRDKQQEVKSEKVFLRGDLSKNLARCLKRCKVCRHCAFNPICVRYSATICSYCTSCLRPVCVFAQL